MRILEANDVHRVMNFPDLIEALREAFGSPAGTPQRMVFPLDPGQSHDAFAVLPAWNTKAMGVKSFTYLPSNPEKGYPVLHAKILLFSRETGEPLALVDGISVTHWRTTAVSALAADYLAPKDASRLLVCGTGHLSTYAALAHSTVRPIRECSIWGRNPEKAAKIVEALKASRDDIEFTVATDLESAARNADVISCVTGSHEPVILGDWVTAGTHTDFIGNHEKHGRECDTELVTKSTLYVDSRLNVLNEAGELLIPIDEGKITTDDVLGELSELCAGTVQGRGDQEGITLFKSVGTALSDLTAAYLAFERQT